MVFALTIKLAFLLIDDRHAIVHGTNYIKTYRVAMVVFPEPKAPKASVAISELGADGTVKPVVILRTR